MSRAPHESAALTGRERVPLTRPGWAAGERQEHRRPLPLVAAEAVARPEARRSGARLADRSRDWHRGGWPEPMAGLRERAAAIRRETLADLEGYLAALTERITEHGGTVHRAATAADAAAAVRRIAAGAGARLVVKSKSMVTEEIELNRALEADGVEVVETDLGEYIVQLGDERPSHIIAPAVHLGREDVADRFEALAGRRLDRDAAALASFARGRLREDFRRADMGVTGVNFAVAETGTLVTVTNEGNARMVTSQPRVHVAVMTLEKVIPRMADLGTLIPLLSYAGTRQPVTVYQSMVTGPRREGETDGPEELHVVILDNGRSRIARGKYAEVLACIRCGACQTACPVFRTLGGGHAYGATYGGPIGAVLSPLLGEHPADAGLPFLSSLCGACGDVCPVKIPLPDMLVDLRADHAERAAPAALAARAGWRAWAAAWSSGRGYALSVAAARLGSRLLPRRLLAALPGPQRRWARGRTLPDLREAGRFRRTLRALRPRREGPADRPEEVGP
ncbi:LUD domain-containing protein [Allonocardiopsis opalescens]|uniref:L-lactate dehydrogenase complex protein LldF n=1 Tax=Allonocardiopsis opalescens TaxID=1144618 RepID=A0A2T0QE89_9ACTN|nr:LUD domain-containing protein [Allonocardiopsis opalescens]PRY02228.1 L-lactate dehydrogenase complex protein LldF [Allonocardiopsis opalescens]